MKTLTSKILSAVLTGALALGVAGCAQPAASNDNGLKTVEAGKLTMATNAFFPPYDDWQEIWREEHDTDERHEFRYAFVDYVKG